MDDLVTFIEARLAEDERLAGRAASLCGCCPSSADWQLGDDEAGGRITLDNPHNLKLKLTRRWNGSYGDLFIGGHIARHDPARVLREVKAKRRQLAALTARPHFLDNREWYGCRAIDEDDQPTGAACSCGRDGDVALHLRLMAAVWSEHPGFRPEWLTEETAE